MTVAELDKESVVDILSDGDNFGDDEVEIVCEALLLTDEEVVPLSLVVGEVVPLTLVVGEVVPLLASFVVGEVVPLLASLVVGEVAPLVV